MQYSPSAEAKREYEFRWPIGESMKEDDKVKLVFRRLPRPREREILASISTPITDEKTRTTRIKFDGCRMDTLYAESIVRIENLDLRQEDGEPVPDDQVLPKEQTGRLSRIQRMLHDNLGLGAKEHGSLEDDLSKWYFTEVMKQRGDDVEKNSPTPLSE